MLYAQRKSLVALLALFLLATGSNASDWRADGVGRVVAIADVHGAYDAMVETLGNVGILDENLAWAGGESYLVIVGDLLDRGPHSRDALDLLMRLEEEAAAAGGKVQVLIGNHESMNLIGDLRYVSKSEYEAFADDETSEQRQRWFRLWARRAGGVWSDHRERFDSEFPPGFFALREAFGPKGKYGKWLLEKNVIAVVNRTAFVHGGLPPEVADLGLEGVNTGLKQDLVDYVNAVETLMEAEVLLPTDSFYDYEDRVNRYMPPLDASQEVLYALTTVKRLGNAPVLHADGPLWYRGNVACSEIVEEHRVKASLAAIGADRVVVGHTPTPTRTVLQRFGGRVIEVDTGMLNAYYKGSGNALVMEGDELRVFNQSGSDAYEPLPHPRKVGSRPGDLSADALQTLLETGEIVGKTRADSTGRVRVKVTDGTHTVSALFNKRGGKGFFPDVAAYRLDRLLGMDMVPVTVLRKVGKDEGSLQFFPEKAADEKQRSSSGQGGSAQCALPLQWEAMYVFDVLIYNEGRSMQRMLYEPSNWNLILIEHESAFKATRGRPPHLAKAPVTVSDGWRETLAELDDTVLEAQLADVLDRRRLDALKTRRDELRAL
ncbi:MAG: metallophosphoesterase [Gammaproteobacteria bacterium]|nr:metallophosphoesterase [Gammaproteobacteria bacterium]